MASKLLLATAPFQVASSTGVTVRWTPIASRSAAARTAPSFQPPRVLLTSISALIPSAGTPAWAIRALAFSTSWTPPFGSVPFGQMSAHSYQNEVSGLTRPANAVSAMALRLIASDIAWRTSGFGELGARLARRIHVQVDGVRATDLDR